MNKKQLHAIDEYVGRQLRSIRLLRGLTQEKLAESINLTFQQLQKYERGANRISASRMYQLSQILGISPSLFFDGLEQSSTRKIPALNKEQVALIQHYQEAPQQIRKAVLTFLKSMSNKTNEGLRNEQNNDTN